MTTVIVIMATVVASIVAAAVAVVALILLVTRRHRRRLRHDAASHILDRLDADYRQARRAMNDAAGQSWRNLVD